MLRSFVSLVVLYLLLIRARPPGQALATGLLLIPAAAQGQQKARVFISDSQSWQMSGSAGGSNGTFAAHSSGGARPQTGEIIKTFGERCPGVVVTNKADKADYG